MAPRKQNEQFLEEIQNSDDDVKLVDSQSSHAEERPALKKRGRKSRWEKLLEDVNNAKKSNPAEVEVAEVEEHKAANVFDYPTIFWKLARPKYGVFTFMCNECRNENFKRGDKRFLLNTGSGQEKLEFTQTFCHDCAKLNFDCTDLIIKHQKKDDVPQKNGGRNSYFKTESELSCTVVIAIVRFSWATVGTLEKQYVVVHLRDGRKFRFRVPRGSFLSPQQLERGMHHGMVSEMERHLTRKRSIQYPDEGEILDMEVVEEEEAEEAPINPLKNRTKLAQLSLKHERDKKEREEEDKRRQQREEQLRKQREEQLRKQREEQQRKQQEEQQRKQREEQQRKQREEQQRKQQGEQQQKQREKEQEKARKSEAERLANEKKTEKERLAKEEEERLAKKKAEDERLANVKKEDERLAREKKKAEDERLAREKKEKEEKKAEEDRLARLKQRELELLKELKPWRGGYMRLVHGKDPTPDVHYLHEKDDYHFVNAVHKYIVRHPELPWDSPVFNPSANIQQNIAEFREIFESEVFDENYELKTREEKNELIELVMGFRFYFADELGRFTLRIFSDKISHITLTDQLAYVLGYEQQQEIHNEDQAKYAVDLAGGVSHLYIYLNSGIIESMIFGNTFANLLQVIAVEGTSGSVVEKDFQSPLFHKIVAREVDVLDVEIRRNLLIRWSELYSNGSNLRLEKYLQQGGSISYFEGAPTFQRGYGYFLGIPRQKGAGVGAVLRNLWRYLRPMIAAAKPYATNIAAEVGKEGLERGARVLGEAARGGDVKEALLAEGREGMKTLLDKASSSLQKGRGRRRRKRGTKAEIILKPSDIIHPITSYIDLSKVFVCTEFKVKKIAEDGVIVDMPANAAVGLIQMPGATFIRNLKVHINQREVYDSNQLYSYKVYLDTELSYPATAKDAYFGVAGYFRDSDPTKVNEKRKKAVEESKSFQAISKLSADIFNQDLYMISNVEIDIELALQSDDFMIHQDAANKDKYTVEIVDCRLIVKTVDLMDGLSLDIARKLDTEPARYGIRKSFMKSLFITGGRYDFSANLFTEEVPRRVVIGLVSNQNYIGHNQKNPFYFNHHNVSTKWQLLMNQIIQVRDIELTASGRTYPQYPYNLDYKNNRYARAYHDAQEHLGMACTTESNGISYSMFKTAYCLYVFQMTNAQEDSPGFELIKEGCTAVNIRFTEAVPNEGVTLIAYGEADGLILIDRNRSITSDLTV
ncbi:hypothetical protein niasHT_028675 [Heterodera trifolii]|uniref:Uncharacterized protein n=1 Tax=Heterodera trifolii TaxID=157864 RepID=A0ABD2KIW0_9BILA